VGNSDPRDFIAAESRRIPFKAALSPPTQWQDAFKNWPLPPIAGWKNWYQRILADKIARKTALEAELRSLSAEIEADNKKIAQLPGLIEKTQEEAKSAIAKVKQCDAKLTTLSGAQKDYHERLDNFRQATSNVRSVIAKYLNI
jgi:septal ring factor EnvC (AmiA/AmiB activator)